MNKTAFCMPMLLLAGLAAPAQAQDPGACPRLPAEAGLTWEHRGSGSSDFCRALRADESEAFGLYIAADSPFQPKRRNREEQGRIDGRSVQWYRAEIATRPNIEAREALLELDDGRVAHIWLQSPSGEQLDRAFQLTQSLQFGPDRSTQVAAGQ
ncbi:MAG: hypothetical protein KY442_05885 [Proteobacteria bacterium]|nr:hypothetical protein [Pseudomonadota bacterium]